MKVSRMMRVDLRDFCPRLPVLTLDLLHLFLWQVPLLVVLGIVFAFFIWPPIVYFEQVFFARDERGGVVVYALSDSSYQITTKKADTYESLVSNKKTVESVLARLGYRINLPFFFNNESNWTLIDSTHQLLLWKVTTNGGGQQYVGQLTTSLGDSVVFRVSTLHEARRFVRKLQSRRSSPRGGSRADVYVYFLSRKPKWGSA